MDTVLIAILVHFNSLLGFYANEPNLGIIPGSAIPARSFSAFSIIPDSFKFNHMDDICKLKENVKYKLYVKNNDSASYSIDSAFMAIYLITPRQNINKLTWDSIFKFDTTGISPVANSTQPLILKTTSTDTAQACFAFQTHKKIIHKENIRYIVSIKVRNKTTTKSYWTYIDPLIGNASDQGSTPPQRPIRRNILIKP